MTTKILKSHISLSACALAATALIAGCGSGESSSIVPGNESDVSSVPHVKGETTPAAVSTPATSTVKTPTSGPLSTEPKVTPPGGAAPTKLVVKDLIKGTGPEAKAGQSVTVNYVGVLFNGGKEFDASWKRSEPFTFTLGQGQVIPGWDKGVAGMKVGGRRELIIPAELAYGPQGSPPVIGPNETLIFVVDLVAAR